MELYNYIQYVVKVDKILWPLVSHFFGLARVGVLILSLNEGSILRAVKPSSRGSLLMLSTMLVRTEGQSGYLVVQ